MDRILILLTSIFTIFSYGQAFEGKLTYKVEFDIKMKGISESDMIEHIKKSGEYFDTIIVNIKNGNYEKLVNSSKSKRIVYKSDVNKIYTFDEGFEYVLIMDAKNYSAKTIEFENWKNKNLFFFPSRFFCEFVFAPHTRLGRRDSTSQGIIAFV